jgi:hypothetical protein
MLFASRINSIYAPCHERTRIIVGCLNRWLCFQSWSRRTTTSTAGCPAGCLYQPGPSFRHRPAQCTLASGTDAAADPLRTLKLNDRNTRLLRVRKCLMSAVYIFFRDDEFYTYNFINIQQNTRRYTRRVPSGRPPERTAIAGCATGAPAAGLYSRIELYMYLRFLFVSPMCENEIDDYIFA